MMRLLFIITILFPVLPIFAQITYENAFPNINFNLPVEIENSGISSDNRLFVVQQAGRIMVVENSPSTTTANVFLDIRSDINFSPGQELGLLGLAFHPNYDQNGYFYIYYTGIEDGTPTIIVERISVNINNPNAANVNSRVKLFEFVKNVNRTNHNGGCITFGPNGYLYISIGDGGGAGDPANNGQDINTPFGKILRIDVDVDGDNPLDNDGVLPDGEYEIPSTNPFANQNGLDEIYAWGIRNMWKMNFDERTNRLWGGDVGQGDFEEINIITAGNYGWNRFEGNSVYDSNTPDPGNTIFPVYAYNHNQGDNSVTGGYVYRGNDVLSKNPNIYGNYIFADYVSGRVWMLKYNPISDSANRTLLFEAQDNGSTISVSTFGKDVFGELYFAGYDTEGSIYKIIDGNTPPSAIVTAGLGTFQNKNNGVNGIVYSQAINSNGALLVGGDFSIADGIVVNNLAVWNGNNWNALAGNGTNGRINAIAVAGNGDVYIGGAFTEVDGIQANYVARYDGNNWFPLSSGTSGPVAAISINSNNEVYIGGSFLAAGGLNTNNIAMWNGSWNDLRNLNPSVAGTNNEVRSIAIDNNNIVYIGGNFTEVSGIEALRIATWNGNTWGTLGTGTSGFVEAIAIDNNYVYAGGNFASAGNQTVNRIARFNLNTLQWEKLGNGLSKTVKALTIKDGFLYVGGAFDNALNNSPASNIIVNSLVRWSNTTGWEALGNGTDVGIDNLANSLVLTDNNISIGGNFTQAGGNVANNIVCWKDNCPAGGVFPDADNDGVCDDDDRCPGIDDALIGTTCEDGDPCTTGDSFNANCICEGIFLDDDNDGICNTNDICPSGDDNIDNNNNGIPDACETTCPIYNFNTNTVLSYDASQDLGYFNIQDNGTTLYMTGNSWKAIEINYNFTRQTVLSFDFKSTTEGEIHEVAFDNNLILDRDEYLVIYGNQGVRGTLNGDFYNGNGNWQNFTVDLGNQFTGFYQYLLLTADDDNNSTGESYFRNVNIFEDDDGDLTCADCLVTISIQDNSNINPGVYAVSDNITSNGVVKNATSVIYKAGSSIELNNAFEVEKGADFLSDIGGCN